MSVKTANELAAKLSPINYMFKGLNCGGCGVVAVCIAEKLTASGYKAKIIELTTHERDAEDLKENNKNIQIARKKKINPNELCVYADSHYCVECDGLYFDSTGLCKKEENNIHTLGMRFSILGEVPIADMKYLAIKQRGNGIWNYNFDESEIPDIIKYIKNALSFLTPKKQKV